MNKQNQTNGSFLKQGTFLAIAGIVTKMIGLAYRIPLVNIMGDKGQGYYAAAFSIYSIALLLSSYSLPLAVSKLISSRVIRGQQNNVLRVFKCALIFAAISGGVAGFIVFFGSGFIADHVISSSLSVYALKVLAPGLVIVAVTGVLRGYFQGMGTMLPTAFSQIIEQIINAILSIVGAYFLFDAGRRLAAQTGNELIASAYAAAGGTIGTVIGALSALVFLGIVFFIYQKKFKIHHTNSTQDAEDYLRIFKIIVITTLPIIMSTVIYNLSEVLDLSLFNKIMFAQGNTEEYVTTLRGMFAGKYWTLINVPLAIANALATACVPSLAAAAVLKDHAVIQKKIGITTKFTMFFAIPCAVGLFVLAKPIMMLIYNGDTSTPAKMLQAGSIAVIFYCLSTVSNAMLQGIDHMSVPIKNAAISLVIHILSVVIMLVVFRMNIYALVFGNIVFSLLMCVLNWKSLRKYTGCHIGIKTTFILPAIAAAVMGCITYFVYYILNLFCGNALSTIVALIAAVIVYSLGVLMLGGLSEEEIQGLPKSDLILHINNKICLRK